jgi:hypothetical protein
MFVKMLFLAIFYSFFALKISLKPDFGVFKFQNPKKDGSGCMAG